MPHIVGEHHRIQKHINLFCVASVFWGRLNICNHTGGRSLMDGLLVDLSTTEISLANNNSG